MTSGLLQAVLEEIDKLGQYFTVTHNFNLVFPFLKLSKIY